MSFLWIFFYTAINFELSEQFQNFVSNMYQGEAFCTSDKACVFLEHCPSLIDLMDRQQLPIHRLRQAVCGYDRRRVKVCCDANVNSQNPSFTGYDSRAVNPMNSLLQCGKIPLQSSNDNGVLYPFLARIGFISPTGEIRYACNGVIINQLSVLTTASCALATSERYKLHSVLVGNFNGDSPSDCDNLHCGYEAQCYNISCVIKHPDYRPDSFRNNIVILQMDRPIRYSDLVSVQPACLAPGRNFVNVGSIGTLVGYGKLSNQRTFSSRDQQCLRMKVLSMQDCSNYYNQGYSVELCAIGNEMPCAGYSGSPLLMKYAESYYLVGILSYGSSCTSKDNFPSVFVDIQKYSRWILENS